MLALEMSCGVGWWVIGGVRQGRPSVLDRPSEPSERAVHPSGDPSGPVRLRPGRPDPSSPSTRPAVPPVDV